MVSRIGTRNKRDKPLKKFCLPKTAIVRDRKVIKQLFSKGSRFKCGSITLLYLPAETHTVGFFASKDIGGVVKRNRIKRILREAYRMNKEIFNRLQIIIYAHGPLELPDVVNAFRVFQERR